MIEWLKQTGAYTTQTRYGIITDYDLLHHHSYNHKTKELTPNFLLPNNVELIYASADKKNDSIKNRMIHLADKLSKEIREKAEGDAGRRNLFLNKPFKFFKGYIRER